MEAVCRVCRGSKYKLALAFFFITVKAEHCFNAEVKWVLNAKITF